MEQEFDERRAFQVRLDQFDGFKLGFVGGDERPTRLFVMRGLPRRRGQMLL